MEFRLLADALELPGGRVTEVLVVTHRFAVVGLRLDAEVAAAALLAVQGIADKEFGEFEEVGNAPGVLELLVDFAIDAGDVDVLPELFAQGGDEFDRLFQALFTAGHAGLFPHDLAERAVELGDGLLPFDGEELVHLRLHGVFGVDELGTVRLVLAGGDAGEIVGNGVRDDEVAVGEALHQGRSAETVGAVHREVGFAEDEEAGEVAHAVVIDPEAAHGVVGGGVDAHRHLVGVLVGDLLVHLEEVAVTLADLVFAEALDRIGKVEIDAAAAGADAAIVVALLFGGAGGDVAGGEVAEGGVLALQVVVALVLGDIAGLAVVASFLRRPAAAVVTQRFGHQGQFRLVIAGLGDAGRVDLGVAGVGEEGALLAGAPGGGDGAAHGVGGEIEDVDITAGGEDDGIPPVALDLAGDEVAGGDPFGITVTDNEVEHLAAGVELDRAGFDLAGEGLVSAQEELLAGLAAGVEGAGDLGAAEGAVVEVAGVVAGKGDALGDALVDDVVGDGGEAIDVGLAGAEVAAFDGVVKEAEDRVAVVGVVLGGVDPALGSDGVGAARRILVTEGFDVVAELAQGGSGGAPGQTGADDEDLVFALIRRIDEFHVLAMFVPFFCEGSGGTFAIEYHGSLSSCSVGLFHDAEKNAQRNQDEAQSDHEGGDFAAGGDGAEGIFVGGAEALQKAARPVQDVQQQDDDGSEIEDGDAAGAQAGGDHGKDVEVSGRGILDDGAGGEEAVEGELHQVDDDEDQEQQPGPEHCLRREGRPLILLAGIVDRTGRLVLQIEGEAEEEVEDHRSRHQRPKGPQDRRKGPQMLGVGIQALGPAEGRQVPQHVRQRKEDQKKSGQCHHVLLAQ